MLSGLANRRDFQSRLDVDRMTSQQADCDLSRLMIDVDHFKLFNDTYGHPEGDVCLTRLARLCPASRPRPWDSPAAMAGEEFCLLLRNTTVIRAREIGEVQEPNMPPRTSSYQCVTVSIGIASSRPNTELRPGDLIEAADAAGMPPNIAAATL